MSKKLIAVAAAAALALTGLVVMPTVATADPGPFTVTVDGASTNQVVRDGTTAAKSLQVNVPSANVLRSTTWLLANASTNSTAIQLTVQTPGATDAVTVSTTGSVLAMTATTFTAASPVANVASGSASLTAAAANGELVLYAITTSTGAGTVVISAAGSSRTLHISGLSDVSTNQYKLAFTAPATAAIGGKVKVTGTVRDMFDNLLTPATGNLSIQVLGGGLTGNATVSDFKVDATSKVVTFDVVVPSSASQAAISITAVTPGSEITAFPGRAVSVFALVSAVDLTAQVATLTAQVAALQATMADMRTKALSVTKKKYNSLARKWNAQNRSARVALKK